MKIIAVTSALLASLALCGCQDLTSSKSSSEAAPSKTEKTSKSTGEKPEPAKEVEKPAAKEDEPKWTSSDKALVLGGVRVSIESVRIGKLTIQGLSDRTTETDKTYLLVTVNISNQNDSKKIDYRSWGSRRSIFDQGGLKDNFGNAYNRITFAITRPVGAVDGSESIYPGKSIQDVLVFEVPVAKMKHLDLELPGANIGGKTPVRFRIDAAKVKKGDD